MLPAPASTASVTPPAPPPVAATVPEKKPFHTIADALIACLMGEINVYQKREAAYRTLTTAPIPERDLSAAKGETNVAHEIYRSRLAEEVAAHSAK